MKNISQKLVSGILSVSMLFGMLAAPFSAYAEDEGVSTDSTATVDVGEPQQAEAVSSETVSSEVTVEPTAEPSAEPTAEPTVEPTQEPESTEAPAESAEPAETPTPEENATPESAKEFVALTVLEPESTDIEAEIGETVTLTTELSRDDVAVSYQWFAMQDAPEGYSSEEEIYSYGDGEPTWYSFVFSDMSETEALEQNPNVTWSGIEMYYGIQNALDEIGEYELAENVSVAWKTENFMLEGYVLSAGYAEDGSVVLYADDDENDAHFVGTLDEDGKWAFASMGEDAEHTYYDWVAIDGATEASYSFEVTDETYSTTYRCVVTVTDEAYLAEVAAIYDSLNDTETNDEVADTESAEDTESTYTLPSPSFRISEPDSGLMLFSGVMTMRRASLLLASGGGSAMVGNPVLYDGAQWVSGLNASYEYITKDEYDRLTAWIDAAPNNDERAERIKKASTIWTQLGADGVNSSLSAYVLDSNGLPTDDTRTYIGFKLTTNPQDGTKMVEVASEWYGQTVYFRPHSDGKSWALDDTVTAIDVPAYTDLTINSDGSYTESSSGTRYKRAVSFLNAYVQDSGQIYSRFLGIFTSDGISGGWLLDNSTGDDIHISIYAVDVDTFNTDPDKYLMDAEGNYRIDSFGWGVCTSEQPDISGKAYWALKDYLSDGYGMIIGHDTLYAYAGTYYDNFGYDLDESSIDADDTATWYYDLNSDKAVTGHTGTWVNGKFEASGDANDQRGGSYYMNQLIGTNAGSISATDSVRGNPDPALSPSLIVAMDVLSNNLALKRYIMYGSDTLKIVRTDYSGSQANANPRLRTPTNYPYAFTEGASVGATVTHTNNQMSFGTIWVNYDESVGNTAIEGGDASPKYATYNGQTGTNNFYMSSNGNFMMNQIGHLPDQTATYDEAALFVNSVMYVSQRKQCEICAANQNGQQTAHFVHRVTSANYMTILTALQNGGTFWYPLDDCYLLTDDITLPEGWTPIKNFSGHWDSDVYSVTLASNGEPLFQNTYTGGDNAGWNLGTDQTEGTMSVFDSSMTRTTGVARVVGDLNDLFGTNTSYNGYTVKILGADNTRYMSADEVYSCTVNSDNKYVISNLPCIYDGTSGILTARVYDRSGNEVTQYGSIRVNVSEEFWKNCETIPLYLWSISADPVSDYSTYEAGQAYFTAHAEADEASLHLARWEYRTSASDSWKEVPSSWDTTITSSVTELATQDYEIYSTLVLNDADPNLDGAMFRAVFTSDSHGEWNTYEYYMTGIVANASGGNKYCGVAQDGEMGQLTVKTWPTYAEQGSDQTIYESLSATFTAYGYALDDGTQISVKWQYGTFDHSTNGVPQYTWVDIDGSEEFIDTNNTEQWTVSEPVVATNDTLMGSIDKELLNTASDNNLDTFHSKATFHGLKTTLTVNKVDILQDQMHFRAVFTAKTAWGTEYTWTSDMPDDTGEASEYKANNYDGAWSTSSGSFGNFTRSAKANNANVLSVLSPDIHVTTLESATFETAVDHQDTMTPDEYGQLLLLPKSSVDDICTGTAAYRVNVYYKGDQIKPTATWQYMTYKDRKAITLSGTTLLRTLDGFSEYGSAIMRVEESTPVAATYNGESGWMMYTSTLYLDNVPLNAFQAEKFLKYYFRCLGTTSYETVKSVKNLSSNDQWGGLTTDYDISIKHNGVLEYDNTNKINDTTVTTVSGIQTATADKEYSDWYFPALSIHVPGNNHINTAIVRFDNSVGTYSTSDTLLVNQSAIEAAGVTVQQNDGKFLVLVSNTANTVSTETWQKILREYVGFRSYDSQADFSIEKCINNTTDGGGIRWFVDENRYAGLTFDPDTGQAYKLVTSTAAIDWETARQNASTYDSELMMSGYLAEISDAHENAFVKSVADGNNVWLGAELNNGSWQWSNSKKAITYSALNPDTAQTQNTNNPGTTGVTTNQNLYMRSDGSWEAGVLLTSRTEQETYSYTVGTKVTKTLSNLGTGGIYPFISGYTYDTSSVLTSSGNMIAGHKYYIYLEAGDYGDSNVGVNLKTYSFTQNLEKSYSGSYNEWRTVLSGVYTSKVNGQAEITVTEKISGTDRTGFDAGIIYFDLFDLTAAWGAGNEPDATWCANNLRSGTGSNGLGLKENATVTVDTTKTVTGTRTVTKYGTSNPVKAYVVEYDTDILGLRTNDHADYDDAVIGTAAKASSDEELIVKATITDNEKVYDGTAIYPSSFTVEGSAGAGKDLFTVQYTLVTTDGHSGYTGKTVSGNNYQDTDAVNVSRYHAKLVLTDEAKAAGWVLDESGSTLECDLTITKRPINVYSYDNNKTYDSTSTAWVTNIQIEPATSTTGVVAGDTVNLSTTSVCGTYLDTTETPTANNSTTNNGGNPWKIARNATLSSLTISHENGSDPYYNYYICREIYDGQITQRGLKVHSTYLEDPEDPRNVKTYDGTSTATISRIVIDGIQGSDTVALKQETLPGTYIKNDNPVSDAGEELDENGSCLPDRDKKLEEYTIQSTEAPELINNPDGNYYIAEEEYSGAIRRNNLDVQVSSIQKLYGNELTEEPWFDPTGYGYAKVAASGAWVQISGLVEGDTLNLDASKSQFKIVGLENQTVLEAVGGKGVSVGTYTLTITNVNESNYDVLRNYVIDRYDGVISVIPREIIIGVNDSDKMTLTENPNFYSTFYLQNDTQTDYDDVGTDEDKSYSDIHLADDDTVADSIYVKNAGGLTTTELVMIDGKSNITYLTECTTNSPARYADLHDTQTYKCDWCENYFGFELGTDHWKLSGYEVQINENVVSGNTLGVKTVTNALGEEVENYTIIYKTGALRVHPKLRFQLKATVPMYVCMYASRGTGDVVEPTNYGITNYSNGAIEVADIYVANDAWILTDGNPSTLRAGEMRFNLNGTLLKMGHNTPATPGDWVAEKGSSEEDLSVDGRWFSESGATENDEGTFLSLPLECNIAGGNVNDAGETHIVKVTYTIQEHVWTLPETPSE